MKIYCTSKNSGPSWGGDPVYMVYIGTSLDEAREAVREDFRRYEVTPDKFPTRHRHIYSAIPADMERDFVVFYDADGWWYSIVSIDIDPVIDLRDNPNK